LDRSVINHDYIPHSLQGACCGCSTLGRGFLPIIA
jgi:hypothetical protein